MGHQTHRREDPAAVPCAIVTVSDTRDPATDRSGDFLRRALLKAGHPVVDYGILKDEPALIVAHLRGLAARGDVRVVLLSGGTGIAPRDTTFEAVTGVMEKRLEGFGELFRSLSYRQIGSPAMLSRAVAGTFRGMVVFSMPGSEKAVRLAMGKLILPELAHVAGLLAKRGG
ncbi:MAG TPA: MogA/MoaB family molybdenum cofactor biosynthesis protein [Candidatus Polarisedimenticolia bacterium]|nr:MogA/MoaB family molybdenum cofactor biosynthesis protein [Candidatus Polarisedimenticolia bacterium]